MTEDNDATNTLWDNAYIAYIPLLGAAVALTFDVGCFYAIGISFFTLFSLSEHIVFAIQAFPIVLALLIPLSVVLVIMGRGGASMPPPYDPTKVSKPSRIAAYVFFFILFLLLISVLGYILVYATAMVLVVIEFAVVGVAIFFINAPYKRVFIASMAILIVLTIAFILGFADGRSYLAKDDTSIGSIIPTASSVVQLKNGALVSGRIIMSGDRGVLLYDPALDRLRFILRDAIGSIEATPPEHTTGP